MNAPKKIIIRMPNWLGDMVMATGLLTHIREYFKKSSITVMCPSHLSSLFKYDPRVDEIFAFSKSLKLFRGKSANRNRLNVLRMGRYDVGILLTNSFSSAFEFFQAGIRKRIGFAKEGRSLFLTSALSFPLELEKRHLCDVYKHLLKPLGIEDSCQGPKIYLEADEKEKAKIFLAQRGVTPLDRIVGVHPGAAYGSAKCWPAERFKEVISELLLGFGDVKILLFGEASSQELLDGIQKDLGERVINLCGQTSLRELIALISCSDVFLTNDSGPMHLADALHIPVIALFGSTNPMKTGPYYQKKVIQKHVKCSPCYKRVCPIDFRCMKQITSSHVYEEITKLLKTKSNA